MEPMTLMELKRACSTLPIRERTRFLLETPLDEESANKLATELVQQGCCVIVEVEDTQALEVFIYRL